MKDVLPPMPTLTMIWPIGSKPVVPGRLTPSGLSYQPLPDGTVEVLGPDIGLLLSMGFGIDLGVLGQ